MPRGENRKPGDMHFRPKLTERQKAVIFDKLMQGESAKTLAAEYGVCEETIRKVGRDRDRLDRRMEIVRADQDRMKIRIMEGAEKALNVEMEILDMEVPEGPKGASVQYLRHQTATSLLDRAGLKHRSEADGAITVTIGGGIELGMPQDNIEYVGGEEKAEP